MDDKDVEQENVIVINKKKENLLDEVLVQKKKKIREDYARGIPDFALSEVAEEAAEGLKRHLRNYILLTSSDPVKQRQMFTVANHVLKELKLDLKEKMEEKLLQFMRSV